MSSLQGLINVQWKLSLVEWILDLRPVAQCQDVLLQRGVNAWSSLGYEGTQREERGHTKRRRAQVQVSKEFRFY